MQKPDYALILSDIHANLPALEAVLAETKDRNIQSYLVLGDIVGYGPWPNETTERVRSLPNLIAIQGNHEAMLVQPEMRSRANDAAAFSSAWTVDVLKQQHLDWLTQLPITVDLKVGVRLVHGGMPKGSERVHYINDHSASENLMLAELQNLRLVLHGHTHVSVVYRRDVIQGRDYKVPGERVEVLQEEVIDLLNPGSVGLPREADPRAQYAIWERHTNAISFHRLAYDHQSVVKAMGKAGLPTAPARALL
ncbi:MAG: metallophosphoesterase family protein [Bacteroidota bacterium]